MACVLLIEDDTDLRFSLAGILQHAGHQAFEASDGKRGLALVDEKHPDLVVSDIVMAEMEGISTILALREKHMQLPILAISGNPFYLNNAEQLGANASLLKPFSSETFLETVNCLLRNPVVSETA